MACIRPTVDRQDARQRLERQRFKRLRRWAGALPRLVGQLVTRSGRANSTTEFNRPLPYMEIVWLPCYHVVIETTSRSGQRDVNVLVDGCDGQSALVQGTDVTFEHRGDVERFPPIITEADAVESAHGGLVSAIMRSPGWRGKPKVGATRSVALVQRPYWVYYYERRAARLDIKVLDAVTGKVPGPKVKLAMIQAFVDAARSQ